MNIIYKPDELIESIKRIKQERGVLSNCFENPATFSQNFEAYEMSHSVLIVKHEYRVDRMLFYTSDPAELILLTHHLPKGQYYLDMLTKDPSLMREILLEGEFNCVAEMERLSSSDITLVLEKDSQVMQYFDRNYGEIATLSDTDEIYDLLWRIFSTGVSHLPDREQLSQSISAGEILVNRGDDGIDALLQTVVKPKSFYINQVYNGSRTRGIHAMMLNRLMDYHSNGGRYVYAWVDRNNTASQKFHKKYGLTHDGLWNMVYQLDIL